METENQVDPNIGLNAAANLILSKLPGNVRERLVETAAIVLNVHLWMLLAGIAQYSFDTGESTSALIDPEWLKNMPASPPVYSESICGWRKCPLPGGKFTPIWPGQRFCSNSCGSAAQREAATTRAPEHVVGGKHPLGQEPEGMLSSALQRKDS